MLFRVYLNGGYIATGDYTSARKAKLAFANLFKINQRQWHTEPVKTTKETLK